jgi:hypothetical protein
MLAEETKHGVFRPRGVEAREDVDERFGQDGGVLLQVDQGGLQFLRDRGGTE